MEKSFTKYETNGGKHPMNDSITGTVMFRPGDCNVHWWGDRLPLRISFTNILELMKSI